MINQYHSSAILLGVEGGQAKILLSYSMTINFQCRQVDLAMIWLHTHNMYSQADLH